jgi:hypothetical protein
VGLRLFSEEGGSGGREYAGRDVMPQVFKSRPPSGAGSGLFTDHRQRGRCCRFTSIITSTSIVVLSSQFLEPSTSTRKNRNWSRSGEVLKR